MREVSCHSMSNMVKWASAKFELKQCMKEHEAIHHLKTYVSDLNISRAEETRHEPAVRFSLGRSSGHLTMSPTVIQKLVAVPQHG